MAINYPGPYEVRILYQDSAVAGGPIEHVQRLNVKLVEPAGQGVLFSAYNFIDINSVNTNTLDTLVENWLAEFLAHFPNTTSIIAVELWKYPTAQSFDAVFWSTYTPVLNVGTSGSAATASGQAIWVFRTQEGGTLKVSLMEASTSPGPPKAYAAMTASQKSLTDFVLDGDGALYSAPFLARDTSYPFAAGKLFPGQNEALWKRRNGR